MLREGQKKPHLPVTPDLRLGVFLSLATCACVCGGGHPAQVLKMSRAQSHGQASTSLPVQLPSTWVYTG